VIEGDVLLENDDEMLDRGCGGGVSTIVGIVAAAIVRKDRRRGEDEGNREARKDYSMVMFGRSQGVRACASGASPLAQTRNLGDRREVL
jgi:hypothetical protein